MAGHREELGIAFLIGLSLYVAHVEAGTRVNPGSCGYPVREIDCTFNVTDAGNMGTTCDTTVRQVFRLLSVNDYRVLLGTAGCLYVLDENLVYTHSAPLRSASSDLATCEYLIPDEYELFLCQNYIAVGIWKTATSLFVCGTYDVANPRCWNCDITAETVTCDSGLTTQYMPRNILRNQTILFTNDGNNDVIFVGAARSYTVISENPVFAQVNANTGTAEAVSDPNANFMSIPKDFVGEPIEYGGFVYFFYREKAEENTITPTIYSRVARVCKNDNGGTTNPLDGDFTTFLKTRLVCSWGQTLPSFYNEIQDVTKSESDPRLIYALFTTPNAGVVSSAICRYNLDELNELFNNENRRGQPNPSDSWQAITKDADDTVNKRNCQEAYLVATYDYLSKYPLLNENAPNCGLTQICNNYDRPSDDALVVLEGIVGQQLLVLNETDNSFVAYVGTNNREVYRVEISTTQAIITEKTVVARRVDLPANDVNDKWPYGISDLFIRSNTVYGTMDHCAFRFTVEVQETPAAELISSRSAPGNYILRPNLPSVTYVIITRLFQAPQGTNIEADFSRMSDVTPDISKCTQKRFDLPSCNTEFLHAVCNVTNFKKFTSTVTGVITVTSRSGRSTPYIDNITVEVDTSSAETPSIDVNEYDNLIAKYEKEYNNWLKNLTCGQDPLPVCKSGPCCTGP